jgi:hypothetical protein
MSIEYEKLQQEEAEKSARLQELTYVSKKYGRIIDNKLTEIQNLNNKKMSSNKGNNLQSDNKKKSCKKSSRFSELDNDRIENICDYYDELQNNLDLFSNNGVDNKSDNSNLNSLSSKLRKNILNRKLIDRRAKHSLKDCLNGFDEKKDGLKTEGGNKSLLSNIISQLEIAALPTLHLHLILSLTMVILTHRCPQYLIVL